MNVSNLQYFEKAIDYNKFRPKYSDHATIALEKKLRHHKSLVGIDVGAGTGIWTRQLQAAIKWKALFAIEPNESLLETGSKLLNKKKSVFWMKGIAENLPFSENSISFISMASVFNLLDHKKALQEAYRVLEPGGILALLWNPIEKEKSKHLFVAERYLRSLLPEIEKTSQKKAKLSTHLKSMLKYNKFINIEYLEYHDAYQFSAENMKNLWTYTNKLRMKMPPEKYNSFLLFLENQFNSTVIYDIKCTTKCWTAQKAEIITTL